MEEMPADAAVTVRDCLKFYGSKKKPNVVLDHLNMTVPRGTIYGLLGASGCGKSTLLTCLVGLRDPQAGRIRVLDQQPGAPDSHVPGPAVGYMPQEIGLMDDFSIVDTMFYFGRIFGMGTAEIERRAEFLQGLLELPPEGKLVRELSGGQQRRVSLAAALLHDPELLILDEPTVGLDPVLRQRIWDYLMEITRQENKTVIITTHYIEEARQSDITGLMRHGRLLAEDSPARLLALHHCGSLEEVFLALSRSQHAREVAEGGQDESSQRNKTSQVPPSENTETCGQVEKSEECSSSRKCLVRRTSHWSVMRALLNKNFVRLRRNRMGLVYTVGFAVMQIGLFFLAIGHDPQRLPLAVVNQEAPPGGQCGDVAPGCNMTGLGCRFLKSLNPDFVTQVLYDDVSSAHAAVRRGKAWGALHIGANFSDAMAARNASGRDVSDDTLVESEIAVWLDMSGSQIGPMLKKELYESYKRYFKDLLVDCGFSRKYGETPILFNKPIYGSENPSFNMFMVPGVLASVVFFLAMGATSLTMVSEFLDGIWNRALVTGVRPSEILWSHVLSQLAVIVFQVLETMLLTFAVFGVENNGSLLLVALLSFLEGVCGMSVGLLISVVCDDMATAINVSTGGFFPMMLVCGIMWPLEGMPWLLRVVSLRLPVTSGNFALRSILIKGWGLAYPDVYVGVATVLAWIVVLLAACLVRLRHKKA